MTDLPYILSAANTGAADACKSRWCVRSKAEVPKVPQIHKTNEVVTANQGGLTLSTQIWSLLMAFKISKPLIKVTLNNSSQSSTQIEDIY